MSERKPTVWESITLKFGTNEFFNDLGYRKRTVSQDTRAGMFLMQWLSVAMPHGNAARILGTIADDDFSTEFFV